MTESLVGETDIVDRHFPFRDLEIVQLRRFLAIVECGTFVAAANKLGMTQQALSTSFAKMEAVAGVKFLERKRGGRISLTVFGRLLKARAQALLALSDRAMTEIGLLRGARGGSINLGIGETMMGRHVAMAIKRFHHQNPDVKIHLSESYTESMIEKLLAGELDFVVGGSVRDPTSGRAVHYRHLFEINDEVVVRSNHPLAAAGQLSLADLADYTWMIPAQRPDIYEAINISFMRASLQPPERILLSDSMIIGIWLCLEGDYIAIVSPDTLGPMIDLGAMTVLDVPHLSVVRHACVITAREAKLSPAATCLMEEIILESERPNQPLSALTRRDCAKPHREILRS